MDWDAIAAVGQLVGAVAVVATLGYLAILIRFSHLAASDTNRLSRAAAIRDALLAVATNDELVRTYMSIFPSSDGPFNAMCEARGITPEQAHKLSLMSQYWWWVHWAQWSSTKTSADVAELRHVIAVMYRAPHMNMLWKTSPARELLDRDFVRFVNETLEHDVANP